MDLAPWGPWAPGAKLHALLKLELKHMFLSNSGIWGKSACHGSIRLVKLVWMLPARAYNTSPRAQI